ncbi:MAG: TonB-dependent receptor [Methylococcaceae bacterium]|jgi:iron complex outermembrane receptor protein
MPNFKPYPLSLAVLTLVSAETLYAETSLNSYALNIPAQPLNHALLSFGQQSKQQIIYNTDIAQGLKSPGLNGVYTTASALQTLLADSGLDYHIAENGTVLINKKPKTEHLPQPAPSQKNEPSSTLPTVKVTDTRLYDATDPYNTDYTLPNATAGTKTDTPIIETPLNVQVISKQVLKDQQAITLGDALKNVSGVAVTSDINGVSNSGTIPNVLSATSITLRGFESQTYSRNGFRLQQGAGTRELANVEAIEVLKGPAAVLYGLVEPGGLVNVVTKQPLATPYYSFNQQFGSFDNYRTTADATGPIAGHEDLLYRLNVSYQTTSGVQDFTGKDDVFVAPVFTWLISPRTQATVEFEYNRQHSGLSTPFNPFINSQLQNIPISRNYGEYTPAVTESFFGGVNWSHQFNDEWTVKHRFSVNQLGFEANNFFTPSFTSGPGAIEELFGLTSPSDGLTVLRNKIGNLAQNNTYSTNLDLVGHFDTGGLRHTLLIGADYYRISNSSQTTSNDALEQRTVIDPFNPIHPGIPIGRIGDLNFGLNEQVDQYGFYVQDQIKLPYDLHITGGFRYQNIRQDTQNTFNGSETSRAILNADATTPRVGLLWHPRDWVSLYANYAESFGINPSGLVFINEGNFAPVAPTSATQYEGGVKTEFLGGRLRATLAYFDLTKTNVGVSDPNPLHNCGSGPGSCSLALGEVRSRGPELDIQGEILPGWNAIATWANVDVIVTKTNADNAPLTQGATFNVGDRLFNVPRNTASFFSTYEFQQGDLKGLKFGGGVTVLEGTIGSGGGHFFDSAILPAIKVPGSATLNLLLGYSRNIGKAKVTAQLNVNNVLDKRYYTNINGNLNDPTLGISGAAASFGAPRTFLGSINIQY